MYLVGPIFMLTVHGIYAILLRSDHAYIDPADTTMHPVHIQFVVYSLIRALGSRQTKDNSVVHVQLYFVVTSCLSLRKKNR